MLDRKEFDPEQLSIIEFKFIKDLIDTPEAFITEKAEGYQLENSLQLAFNLEEKLVKVDFTVEITTESKGLNSKETSGSFHLVFIYRVMNLEELAKPGKNNMIELHPDLGNALSSVTYSTSRGILMTRMQGTALQNFILPIINPNKLLPNT
ncbi:MAG: hypothetical protein NTX61_08745 [Bacteroidetes bacterium]|nr:hypothetical protein [Bacteroidota bacterium]